MKRTGASTTIGGMNGLVDHHDADAVNRGLCSARGGKLVLLVVVAYILGYATVAVWQPEAEQQHQHHHQTSCHGPDGHGDIGEGTAPLEEGDVDFLISSAGACLERGATSWDELLSKKVGHCTPTITLKDWEKLNDGVEMVILQVYNKDMLKEFPKRPLIINLWLDPICPSASHVWKEAVELYHYHNLDGSSEAPRELPDIKHYQESPLLKNGLPPGVVVNIHMFPLSFHPNSFLALQAYYLLPEHLRMGLLSKLYENRLHFYHDPTMGSSKDDLLHEMTGYMARAEDQDTGDAEEEDGNEGKEVISLSAAAKKEAFQRARRHYKISVMKGAFSSPQYEVEGRGHLPMGHASSIAHAVVRFWDADDA